MDSQQYLEPEYKSKTIVNRQNKAKTKIHLKYDSNKETLQPTKQNDMVAVRNNYKVSKSEYRTNEDKNKQIYSQVKIQNEHLKNITKIDKYKNWTALPRWRTKQNTTTLW